jgi:hypothetical protein
MWKISRSFVVAFDRASHWRWLERRYTSEEAQFAATSVAENYGNAVTVKIAATAHSNGTECIVTETIVPRLYLSAGMIMDVSQGKVIAGGRMEQKSQQANSAQACSQNKGR